MTHLSTSVIWRSALSSPAYWSLCFAGSSSGRGATSARAGVLPSACTRHSAYSRLSMKSTKTFAAFGCGAPLTTAERELRADAAGLETELRDRNRAHAVLHAP